MSDTVVSMRADVVFRHAEPVMGTIVSFEVRPRGTAPDHAWAAISDACRVLHHADDVFSVYRPDSPLTRLRRRELTLTECPPDVAAVLALCQTAREQSGGWFDPWAMPGGVDPTGLVKGWAAREAATALRNAGVAAGLVNAAGDIAVFGRPAGRQGWRVGIRSPDAPDRLLCVVDADGAVATSGSYERGDHVLDAGTGCPATAAVSATVCGPDLAFADAFATGLLSAGEAGFDPLVRAGYEALIVTPTRSVRHTDAFPLSRRADL
jgi:thiamine biosynthesis lipoprotein